MGTEEAWIMSTDILSIQRGRGAIIGHIESSFVSRDPVLKEIALVPLNIGFAIIDAEDLELVSRYRWRFCQRTTRLAYAVTSYKKADGKWKLIFMHRLIAKTPEGVMTDHRDGNGLNNCKSNLRIATNAQNQHNAGIRVDKRHSKYKGVTKDRKRWRAQIRIKGKKTYLGNYTTERDAALAYDLAAQQHFGEYANINGISKEIVRNGRFSADTKADKRRA